MYSISTQRQSQILELNLFWPVAVPQGGVFIPRSIVYVADIQLYFLSSPFKRNGKHLFENNLLVTKTNSL